MEKHRIARMVAASVGYVGYDEAASSPGHSAVGRFGEVEKAHPGVFNILLQVLDGRAVDSQGRTADFNNTILVVLGAFLRSGLSRGM